MGLTINYTLSLDDKISEDVVHELARRTGRFARKIGCAKVGPVARADENPHFAWHFFKTGRETYSSADPESGWLISILPGEGSEMARFGLCRYPSQVLLNGALVSTGARKGWRLQSFCKTQYAGEHGWENFLKCHCMVISLLDFWKSAGAGVEVMDEGDFWETRSVEKLRRQFDRYNGLVAAMGGMLKDATSLSIKSPIFDYKNFERLEHEGWKEFGGKLQQLRKELGE